MNKPYTLIGILIIGFILQAGVAPYISIMGAAPNFFLIIVTVAALTNGSDKGALVGFVAGLMLDLMGTGPVGSWALVLSVTGYVTGLLDQHLFAEGWLLPVTVLSFASLIGEFLYLCVVVTLGSELPFFSSIWSLVLPTTLYTIFIAVLAFPLLSRLLQEEQSIASFKRVA